MNPAKHIFSEICFENHWIFDMSITKKRQKHHVEIVCQFVYSIKGSQVIIFRGFFMIMTVIVPAESSISVI
jgi:hypothetical protein